MAIALVDVLQRAGWVKRALFLADRIALVNQACNAFKTHLPESSPVNLVTDKETEGRVYVGTYPTMMGLIDETKGGDPYAAWVESASGSRQKDQLATAGKHLDQGVYETVTGGTLR